VRAEAVLGRQRVQVRQDLLARREAPAPAPGPKRERVQVRRYVAGQARIAVIAPRSAEVIGAVQHDEIVDARLLERDRHADPAESRADDDHPVRHGRSLALCSARCHMGPDRHKPGTGSITFACPPAQRRAGAQAAHLADARAAGTSLL
jgi:hypothetical protein